MDAVEVLLNKLDVLDLLEYYNFEGIKTDGEVIRSCCKLHGGTNPTAFAIHQDRTIWHCHTGGCGSGNVFTLIQIMEGFTDEKSKFIQSVKWLANFLKVDITNLSIIENKQNYIKDFNKFMKLVKKNKKKEFEEYVIEGEVKPVAKFRAFNKETLEHFNLGYVSEAKLAKRDGSPYTTKNRLVFPVVFEGKQVGVLFRRVKSTDVPKWLNQPANIETGNMLYNYDDAHSSREIALCEGLPDVWAFHEIDISAVATFGAHLTDEQVKLLLKTGADIVIAFDGDEAGRLATSKVVKLLKHKANISVINFPDGKDAESVTREELKDLYDSRRKV